MSSLAILLAVAVLNDETADNIQLGDISIAYNNISGGTHDGTTELRRITITMPKKGEQG